VDAAENGAFLPAMPMAQARRYSGSCYAGGHYGGGHKQAAVSLLALGLLAGQTDAHMVELMVDDAVGTDPFLERQLFQREEEDGYRTVRLALSSHPLMCVHVLGHAYRSEHLQVWRCPAQARFSSQFLIPANGSGQIKLAEKSHMCWDNPGGQILQLWTCDEPNKEANMQFVIHTEDSGWVRYLHYDLPDEVDAEHTEYPDIADAMRHAKEEGYAGFSVQFGQVWFKKVKSLVKTDLHFMGTDNPVVFYVYRPRGDTTIRLAKDNSSCVGVIDNNKHGNMFTLMNCDAVLYAHRLDANVRFAIEDTVALKGKPKKPPDLVVRGMQPHNDCTTDAKKYAKLSPNKQEWCCLARGVCVTTTTTTGFNCTGSPSKDWTIGQRVHCCLQAGIGCPDSINAANSSRDPAVIGATSTDSADLQNCSGNESDWSQQGRDWCCSHKGVGCSGCHVMCVFQGNKSSCLDHIRLFAAGHYGGGGVSCENSLTYVRLSCVTTGTPCDDCGIADACRERDSGGSTTLSPGAESNAHDTNKASNRSGPEVLLSMEIKNLDFARLIGNPDLVRGVKNAVTQAVSQILGHGLQPDRLATKLAAGSVLVTTSIRPPNGLSASKAQSTLASSDLLGTSIAGAVQHLDSIEDASTGTIGISGLKAVVRQNEASDSNFRKSTVLALRPIALEPFILGIVGLVFVGLVLAACIMLWRATQSKRVDPETKDPAGAQEHRALSVTSDDTEDSVSGPLVWRFGRIVDAGRPYSSLYDVELDSTGTGPKPAASLRAPDQQRGPLMLTSN